MVLEKKVYSLVSDRIGHCEKKCNTNVSLILIGHRDKNVGISRPEVVNFFWGVGGVG
jgi:hypothetical protein